MSSTPTAAESGPVQQRIETALTNSFELAHLVVANESAGHNVPPGSESHFKVVLVSGAFEGQSRVQRHRMVNRLLAEELAGPVHALSVHAYTMPEWQARNGDAPLSPPCRGGSGA